MRNAVLFACTASLLLVACDSGGNPDGGVGDGGNNAPCTGSMGASVPSGQTESRTRYQAATVPFGSTCMSEMQTRGCTNGTWGSWTGSYKAESCAVSGGSCQGAASDCVSMDMSTCSSQAGCTFQAASCRSPSGPGATAYNCGDITTSTACPMFPGCTWNGSACTGGAQTCDSKNMTDCNALDALGGICTWKGACAGTPADCSTFSSMTTCTAQAGCTWM